MRRKVKCPGLELVSLGLGRSFLETLSFPLLCDKEQESQNRPNPPKQKQSATPNENPKQVVFALGCGHLAL